MPGDKNKQSSGTYSGPIWTAMKHLGDMLPKRAHWPDDGIPPGAAAVLLSRGSVTHQPIQKGNINPGFTINSVFAATERGEMLRGIDAAGGVDTTVPEWQFFAGGFIHGFLKICDALDKIQKENGDLRKKVEILEGKVAKQDKTIEELKAMIKEQNDTHAAAIKRLESTIETQNTDLTALRLRVSALKNSTKKDVDDLWDFVDPSSAPGPLPGEQ